MQDKPGLEEIIDELDLQALQSGEDLNGPPRSSSNGATKPVIKPVMSQAVEADVLNAISQFQHRDKWREWGLHNIREQGAAVLLEGPPGTGKTTIARWAAKKVKKGFKQLTVSELGGSEPGQHEKLINAFFEDCKRRKNATIFMDECDHLLMSRDSISAEGKTWQLGGIETLMMNINVYPGLIICATNHVSSLDSALADRFISIIHVGEPDFKMRTLLWRAKIPKLFPFRPDQHELHKLAKYELNGRQIENVIVAVGSEAIRQNSKPKLTHFEKYCEREKGKHIETKPD